MGSAAAPIIANGWSVYAHPLFLEQAADLLADVKTSRERDPQIWHKKNSAKRLAAVLRLISEIIPADPGAPQFRQGGTLGDNRKHWFRAKFLQQYRLFYRFDSREKIIVITWVNDEKTLRAYGSRTDAYAVFQAMLDGGNPPDDFDALVKAAKAAAGQFRQNLKDMAVD